MQAVENMQTEISDNVVEDKRVGDICGVHCQILECPVEPFPNHGAVLSWLNFVDELATWVHGMHRIHGVDAAGRSERMQTEVRLGPAQELFSVRSDLEVQVDDPLSKRFDRSVVLHSFALKPTLFLHVPLGNLRRLFLRHWMNQGFVEIQQQHRLFAVLLPDVVSDVSECLCPRQLFLPL